MSMVDTILVIAPCRRIADIYIKYFNCNGLKIDIEVLEELNYGKNIKTIINKINSYKKLGKQIIITRGLLSKLLKRRGDFDVVAVNISEFDVLKLMYKYKDFKEPIGVIECDIYTEKVKKIGELMGLDIHTYVVNRIQDFEGLTNQAINDGMKLLIGSAWFDYNHDYMSKIGVKYETIESSEYEVKESVQHAFELYKILFKEKRKNEMLKTILSFSLDGIISIDKSSSIIIFNPVAEKIFKFNEKDIIGKPICEVIPQIKLTEVLKSKKVELGEVHKVNNTEIVVNRVPMIVNNEVIGAIATFQEVRDIQEVEKKIRYKLAERGLEAKYNFDQIIGKSNKMLKTIEAARIYSKTDATILITGETGTGKEIFAQSIHNASNRKCNPFVAINCSALPRDLLASELFGYCEGAFTGSRKGGKQGIFELAHKGTIFLDEIGEIDLSMQSMLLRVLQEKEIMRIGDNKVVPVDVRIIAATNKNLRREVENGKFRADLYYRLNVLNIKIPALRQRKEDIYDLVNGLIKKLNEQLKCKVLKVDNKILKVFNEYRWPGNIRELQNILEKIVVITRCGVAKYENLKFIFEDIQNNSDDVNDNSIYDLTLGEIENRVIEKVLSDENFNKTKAAKRLGIDRGTLSRKLSKYGNGS